MHILILGGGGREHAFAWAIVQNQACTRLSVAPGNAGIAAYADCVALDPCDGAAIAGWCRREGAGFVVIGPEAPLAAGVADALGAAGILAFGPSRAAARLETSKSFAKEICDAAGAPTARWARFDAEGPALAHLRATGAPVVVKADGLAAGKGVSVAATLAEAEAAVRALYAADPGAPVVIEEFMTGEEASLFVLCDGAATRVLGSAQDYKRAFDGDRGPNTGGMGAVSPAPALTPAVEARAMAEIVGPVLAEMARRGTPFRGVLYAGLMIEGGRPRLVEFNARFGDPEAQVLAVRAGPVLLDALLATARGTLAGHRVALAPEPAVTVVMAARGYPGAHAKGEPIGGLAAAGAVPGVTLFHSATRAGGGRILSAGGRVLSVTATAADAAAARARAYRAVDLIDWPGGFCRRDIGLPVPGG